MNFVESLMIYRIDQITYFSFVIVGILYSLVTNATTMFQMVLFIVILTFSVVAYPNLNYLVHITLKWNQQLI
jgi:hypothetical protein